MAFVDYYKILEVDKNAAEADIKKAYRKLARKYHPDLNPNDKDAEKKFKALNEANEVLSNPESREKYDQYWENTVPISGGGSSNYTAQNDGYATFSKRDYSDFFESIFGGTSGDWQRKSAFRGQDLKAEIQLDLKDAYTSHQRTLSINGKNIRLTIPSGLENGQQIKISGKGGPGVNGGPDGDLYLTFTLKNNSKFKLDQHNLYCTLDLDLYTAVLGGEITVDTFDGKLKLKVKPGTQSDTKVRLKGKGFPIYKKEGEFGDLYISFRIVIPQDLSSREMDLFSQLARLREKSPDF